MTIRDPMEEATELLLRQQEEIRRLREQLAAAQRPINLIDPPAALKGVARTVGEGWDLRNLTPAQRDQLQQMERDLGGLPVHGDNPFAIRVTVAEIMSWDTRATTWAAAANDAVWAANVLTAWYQKIVSTRERAEADLARLCGRMPELRALGENAGRPLALPQPAPVAAQNASQAPAPTDGEDEAEIDDETLADSDHLGGV